MSNKPKTITRQRQIARARKIGDKQLADLLRYPNVQIGVSYERLV